MFYNFPATSKSFFNSNRTGEKRMNVQINTQYSNKYYKDKIIDKLDEERK